MSTQAEVKQKRDFVVQLLTTNNTMSPNDVVEKVTKKFGSGIAKPDIASIRMEKFGIKLGPGGSVLTVKAKKSNRPTQPAVIQGPEEETNTKLARLVGDLQNEMRARNIPTITISAEGPVKVTQTVERVLHISA